MKKTRLTMAHGRRGCRVNATATVLDIHNGVMVVVIADTGDDRRRLLSQSSARVSASSELYYSLTSCLVTRSTAVPGSAGGGRNSAFLEAGSGVTAADGGQGASSPSPRRK